MLKIAIFSEAEKGKFHFPYFIKNLEDLLEIVGNPKDSLGIHIAVQTLLYKDEVIFFRVLEEGFSCKDYFLGLKNLKEKIKKIDGLALPGVGDSNIIKEAKKICDICGSFLIMSEKDLYDYLTNNHFFFKNGFS